MGDKYKHLKLVVDYSDIILEVLDSRFPRYCRLYKIEEYLKNNKKHIIILLNKADLVPKEFLDRVVEDFSKELPTVYISTKERYGSRRLRNVIKSIGKKIEKKKVYIGVIGYPNVGKSSVINILVGKGVAGVSPIPGFTRGIQFIKLSRRYYLIDSPGVYYPKNKYILMILGAILPEKIENPIKGLYFLYKKIGKKPFEEAYGIDEIKNFKDLIVKVREKLNIREKDWLNKVVVRIIHDWQRGKIKGYWY